MTKEGPMNQSPAPWRKSIRSNASGGCVEVTWLDGASSDDGSAAVLPPQ
jgi:hypothetical protein